MQRNVLTRDADVAARDLPVANQSRHDELGGVARYGKAQALRRQDDGGVDADDFAARVDQRAAAVAGVEGGVGLDHVVDQRPPTLRKVRPIALTTPAVTVV